MTARTPTIVPHRTRTITPELISSAANLVRITNDDKGLHRALDRAGRILMLQPWSYDEEGVLAIASESTANEVYHCDRDYCECPTPEHMWCKHRAAYMIVALIFAAGRIVEATLPLPDLSQADATYAPRLDNASYDRLTADINDALFA